MLCRKQRSIDTKQIKVMENLQLNIEQQLVAKFNLSNGFFRNDNSVITFISKENKPNRHFDVYTPKYKQNGELVNSNDFCLFFFHLGLNAIEVI